MTETFQGSIELVVPEPTPTPNTWLHKHWSHYRKIKKRWVNHIWAAASKARAPKKPKLAKVSIEIIRFSPRGIHDFDNLIGGLKPVIDALVLNELIADDSVKTIGIPSVQQYRAPAHEARTVIRITTEGL